MSGFRLGTLLFVVAALLAVALPAHACRCVVSDPRDELAASDGAFIGELVSQEPDPEDHTQSTYTFKVLEGVKGDFQSTVNVRSATDGAACGLEMDPGQRTGLFLYKNTDGKWTSSMCGRIEPDDLRAAAKPLPEPDGKGTPRLLVGGSFGKARVMALNASGKTLDYGFGGNQDVVELDRCPGSQRTVEVAQMFNDRQNRWRISISSRVIENAREISETVARFLWEKGYSFYWPAGVSCQSKDASKSVMFVSRGYGVYPKAALAYVKDGEITTIVRLTGREVAFGDGIAYLTAGKYARKVVSVALSGPGAVKRTIAQGRRQISGLKLSPDGRKLVGLQAGACDSDSCKPSKLVLIRIGSGRVERRILKHARDTGEVAWWGNRKIAVAGVGKDRSSVHSYNLGLRRLGTVRGWSALSPVVLDGKIYGLNYGRLVAARLPSGEARRLGRLPSPVTNVIATLH